MQTNALIERGAEVENELLVLTVFQQQHEPQPHQSKKKSGNIDWNRITGPK